MSMLSKAAKVGHHLPIDYSLGANGHFDPYCPETTLLIKEALQEMGYTSHDLSLRPDELLAIYLQSWTTNGRNALIRESFSRIVSRTMKLARFARSLVFSLDIRGNEIYYPPFKEKLRGKHQHTPPAHLRRRSPVCNRDTQSWPLPPNHFGTTAILRAGGFYFAKAKL